MYHPAACMLRRHAFLLPAVMILLAPGAAAFAQDRLTPLVDPFIGTGGHGHTYPGPSLPFGMIQPGPDTRLTGWDGCSGYHYSDTRLYGFSHTHLSGTGIPDYTDILLMPTAGEAHLNNGADGEPGYSSAFSHDEEVAQPGYYAVTLKDYDIRAELTTTLRVGLHRYRLPAGRPAQVIVDLEHRDRLLESALDVVSPTEVAGVRRSSSWARDQVVYFVIRFSRPFTTSSETTVAGRKQAFHFGDTGGELLAKVAISAVSIEGARKNLETELPHWDFEAVRGAADAAWEKELSKIRVTGGTRDQRVTFYTALYHAMLAPNVFMDVDGRYRGRDLRIHQAEGFTYYTVFSLWDTFRALHPLLTLIDRERTRDFVRTFLRQYEDGGRLPVWELAANETDTMIGYHAVPVIADAIAKGVDGFDVDLAFEAMKASAEEDRFGLAAYKRHGFIDASEEAEGVSRTLEYAFDDWTIAEVARRLGRTDDQKRYLARSQSWKHLFDPATGFMRARVEGFWMTPFDPAEVNNHYTEANAWQYSFFVPHDVGGLMRVMGGPEAFAQKLDALFTADSRTSGRDQPDITGLIGQYAHGNEPSHHMAYLYAYAGQPWKTQALVRRILDTLYAPAPDGLSGNEDCGQMSAWYVFSALGFYPVAPGSTQYVIGSPLFESATIQFEHGSALTIRTRGDGPYVQRAALDGRAYEQAFIDHETLIAGGELVFDLGVSPNTQWGSAVEARPRSFVEGVRVIPAPFVVQGTRLFRGSQQVTLGSAEPAAAIHYTLDGSEPARTSPRYAGAVNVDASLTLRARAFLDGDASPAIAVSFRRLPDYPRIALSASYAPQYAAGGDDTLVDGLRGNDSFKTGRWQGYRGHDLDVTLDFGTPREMTSVGMGFLQDAGSWIMMPRRISVEISDDGERFREVGNARSDVDEREMRPTVRDLIVELPSAVRARYVRLRVTTYGKLPAWHPGAGEDAWFFTDEVIVR
ncbi:MAG TPA: GH92 family glycosyl hydrolase [Vicinamibacterales bacterium]